MNTPNPARRHDRLTLPSRPGPITPPSRPDARAMRPRPGPAAPPGTLTTAQLKVTLALNAAELNATKVPRDEPRITLPQSPPRLRPSAKRRQRSAKPALTTSRSCCKGSLISGDVVAEARLSAQPKAAKSPQNRNQTWAGGIVSDGAP